MRLLYVFNRSFLVSMSTFYYHFCHAIKKLHFLCDVFFGLCIVTKVSGVCVHRLLCTDIMLSLSDSLPGWFHFRQRAGGATYDVAGKVVNDSKSSVTSAFFFSISSVRLSVLTTGLTALLISERPPPLYRTLNTVRIHTSNTLCVVVRGRTHFGGWEGGGWRGLSIPVMINIKLYSFNKNYNITNY